MMKLGTNCTAVTAIERQPTLSAGEESVKSGMDAGTVTAAQGLIPSIRGQLGPTGANSHTLSNSTTYNPRAMSTSQ